MDQLEALWRDLIDYLPTLLGAVGILILGWLAAVIVSSVVRALFNRTTLDDKIASWMAGEGDPPPIGRWIATSVKWVILLFTLMLVLAQLGLDTALEPVSDLVSKVTNYVPQLGGAFILVVVAFLVATGLRMMVTKGLGAIRLDERLNKATGDETDAVPVSKSIAVAVYWIVWLLFLLPILEALQLHGLMEPIQEMANKVFGFVPNLLSALVIGVVGWFVATIVRRIVTSVSAAVGADRVASSAGLDKVGKGSLSGLLGTVVFLLILIPVLTMALDALQLTAVSEPVSGLLDTLVQAVPNLLYAAVIVGVAILIGGLVGGLVADLLSRVGFDNVFGVLGISSVDASAMDEGKRPSAVVGTIVRLAILLFAGMEALDKLGLVKVAGLVNEFVALAGSWLFGIVIFGLGLWLASFVYKIIRDRNTPSSATLANVARIAISALAGIAALDKMGIADDVVQWGVIVTIAAVGLAVGLAFGLGCQKQAADQIDRWQRRSRQDD